MTKHLGLICATIAALAMAREAHAYQFDDDELLYQVVYASTPVTLHGRVVDGEGVPIVGAQLRLIAWGDNLANDGEAAISWSGGEFELAGLARRNALLEVAIDGYYSEIVPVNLQVELGEHTVELGDVELTARQFGRARMTFAGDAMFARRMFDAGVLAPESLAADTQAVFRFVTPLLQADDHTAVNLETSVTDELGTPHPTKSYVFASDPESVAQLPGVGIDSVSLGNNHVYDYLEQGMADTLLHLDAIGLPYYGAGMSPAKAEATVHRLDLNGVAVSLQGFSDQIGYSYGGDQYQIVTRDDPPKGGALPAFTEQLDAFVDGEVAGGRLAIPIIHGGTEYAWTQSPDMHANFQRVIEHGAGLVIAHHPHVVHGVSVIDAGDGPRFVFGSLGNFVFDQNIFETMRSYLAIVDVVEGAEGPEVERIRLAPIRLDDYVPRPLAGAAIAKLGRHLAQLSTNEAAVSGFDGAVIFAERGRLVVVADEREVTTTDLIDTLELSVDTGSTGPVAVDPFTATDALAALSSDAAATCELGRDLLGIGDFEEPDVDDGYLEADLWVQSAHHRVQGSETHSGTGAAVLLRRSSSQSRTSLWVDRPIAVTGGRDMTIIGWHKGVNAGQFRVTVRWIDDAGSTISHTSRYKNFDQDYDWSRFAIDLGVPANAKSVMVFFRHYPPNGGDEGRVLLDDVAFVEWAPEAVSLDGNAVSLDGNEVEIATPNGWDFVRCEVAEEQLELKLTHRIYESR